MKKENLYKKIENVKTRSSWTRGVKEYALELVDGLEVDEVPTEGLESLLLNGAEDWTQYSWGGCAYVYNCQIARALCTPSELARTRNGERRPNAREEWLDVQARALWQAARLIRDCME